MDFRCCVRLIEYGSLWHGLDSPIIPLRYRLLRHHQVKSVRYSDRFVAEYSEFVFILLNLKLSDYPELNILFIINGCKRYMRL